MGGTGGRHWPPSYAGDEHRWRLARAWCLHEARRVLRNPADVEEAAQNALLRAWRHRGAQLESWEAWLRTVARNEALRLVEKSRRRDEMESREGAREQVFEDPGLRNVVDSVFLEGLLAFWPIEDRLILRLRYFHDMTQTAIAAALGIPEGTVKVRLHRLRRRLQEQAGDMPL